MAAPECIVFNGRSKTLLYVFPKKYKCTFFSDLRSIRLAKKGKTQMRLLTIKFDLTKRIGNA